LLFFFVFLVLEKERKESSTSLEQTLLALSSIFITHSLEKKKKRNHKENYFY